MSARRAAGVFLGCSFTLLLVAAAPRAVWFEDLAGSLELDDRDGEAIVRAVAQALAAGKAGLGDLPPEWAKDRKPRVVFLAASQGRRCARTSTGSGAGLRAALEDAVARLRRRGVAGSRWLRVDVVRGPGRRVSYVPGKRLALDRELEGVAFPRDLGVAFLPAELVAHTILNTGGELVERNVEKALRRRGAAPDERPRSVAKRPVEVSAFTTAAFFLGDGRFRRIYRGHQVVEKATPELVLEAAREAADYLRRATGDSGKFAYVYLPKQDVEARKYNLVRHAGAAYSMLELHEVAPDRELLEAARRALAYLLDHVEDFRDDGRMAMLVSDDKVKLGGVALTLLALAKHVQVTGERQRLPLMRKLARYIRHSQLADGKFISQRRYPSMAVREDFESEYYPGEAILSLLRLHALDPQEAWLDGAEKGARYLIQVRDAKVSTLKLLHDHWLLYALNELHRLRPDEIFLRQAMRISRAITAGQNRSPRFPDQLGSYYTPPRSTPTATRTEGLLAAHALARDHGKRDDAARILEAVRLGIRFQLEMQFAPERVLFLDDPGRTLGGYPRSFSNYEVRIDYVQHNISSLLGYYRLLRAGE
ncbi:MAG: hypothetical protein O7J95_17255 [Planctomycetota bacterium]|nr:hypothetical protein [Planctomycetota bacterium]